MRDNSHYTILGFMRTKLGLQGNLVDLFALIYDACQDEEINDCRLSYKSLAERMGVVRRTAINLVKELQDTGLIMVKPSSNGKSHEVNNYSINYKMFDRMMEGGGENISLGGGEKNSPPQQESPSPEKEISYSLSLNNPYPITLAEKQTPSKELQHLPEFLGNSLQKEESVKENEQTCLFTDNQEIDKEQPIKEAFERFYSAYPKKLAKQSAYKAFRRIPHILELVDKIIESLERHKKSTQWLEADGKYIPYPATWLNGKRWEDEVEIDKKKELEDAVKDVPWELGW